MQYSNFGTSQAPNLINGLLQAGYSFLKTGDFNRATDCFTRAINMDPTNNFAQDGLILAEVRLPSIQALENGTVFFHKTNAYNYISSICTEQRCAFYKGLLERIKSNNLSILNGAIIARDFIVVKSLSLNIISYDETNEYAHLNSFLADLKIVSLNELFSVLTPYTELESYIDLKSVAGEQAKQALEQIEHDRANWLAECINKSTEARDFASMRKFGALLVDLDSTNEQARLAELFGALRIVSLDELDGVKKVFDKLPEYKRNVEFFSDETNEALSRTLARNKKKRKKSLIMYSSIIGGAVLAIIIALAVFFNSNVYKFKTKKTDGGVKIVEYRGNEAEVEIPSKIGGKTVVEIGEYAFGDAESNEKITSITIPSTVKNIEDRAFYGCDNLDTIFIPNTVTSVGYCAVYNHSSDLKIYVDVPIKPAGWDSYWYNSSYATVYWDASKVETVGDYTITVGSDNNTTIVEYNGTSAELEIPATLGGYTVKAIGKEAFYNHLELKTVKISSGITSIDARAFYGCDNLDTIFIPNTVTSVGYYAVYNYSKIYVDMPSKPFCWDSYWYNSSDSTVYWDASKVETVGDYTITVGSDNNATIVEYNGTIAELEIPATLGGYTVKAIGKEAFYNHLELKTVKISSGITSIGERAFYGCDNLDTIFIPNTATSVGYYAVYNHSKIYVDMPSKPANWDSYWYNSSDSMVYWDTVDVGVTDDGMSWIVNKDGDLRIIKYTGTATNLVIPVTINGYTVKAIGKEAFYNDLELKTVKISSGITSIGERAFYGCDNLDTIFIPNTVTSVGYSAVYNHSKIYVDVPSKPAGWDSYWYSSSYATVYWDASKVETVGDYTIAVGSNNNATIVEYNGTIAELEIPATLGGYTVKAIGKEAFYNHLELKTVKISSGITSIGERAFYGCNCLTMAFIPDTVTSVGYYAFYYGNGLKIYCEASSKPAGWDSYWYNSSDSTVYWETVVGET